MQNIVTLGEINDALKIASVTAAQLADMGFAALANKPICEGLPPEESRRLRNAKLYPAESIGQIRVALAKRLAAPAPAQTGQTTGSVSNATCHPAQFDAGNSGNKTPQAAQQGFSVSNAETPQAAPAAVAAPAQALTGEARAEAIKRLAPIRAKLAAAASAVAVPDERAAFEVGILKYTPHAILDCHDGQYVIPWVQAAWTGWQARAALAATPTAAAPLPLLVRDIARELGITCTEACLALKPLGNFSTNTAVTAEMMAKLRECFPERVPASEVAGARERMTVGRACYFMERFLKEEKLLGPNEQAALHYVIDMLEAADAQVVLPEPWPTADDLAGAYEDAFKRKPAGQIWANLVVLVEALHARRALLAGVSAPAAQADHLAGVVQQVFDALQDKIDARGPIVKSNLQHYVNLLREAFDASEPAPQAQADARDAELLAFAVSEIRRDEMTDSALLDAMEQNRIAVVPEYEGPWDAEIYNDEGKPNHRGSGSTPREAIRAALAAQAAQGGE